MDLLNYSPSQQDGRESGDDKLTVYQCKNCKAVLSNDRFRVENDIDQKKIYLQDIENCLMETSVKTSKSQIDYKCQYRNLECSQCHRHLGRQYCKVTEKLKHLDGLNVVDTAEISLFTIRVPLGVSRSADHERLEERVKQLEDKLADASKKIEDLALVCIDACKDRVGIKEAVANLLLLISNEFGGGDSD
ncbi:uncharacterized protein LOC132198172 [Neocloeon triangulifer]|uniref:uncharacterized protein LOC132198172 n=1 Tax=Neocloeon triangulifer TaxID=2078957 RepID=UPI00286F4C3D|nr:uncharacterized protein LOC132198172 [Neocloeon triangulifer]